MDEGKSCLVCMRVDDMDTAVVSPGSSVDSCARCGVRVWISPSGRAFVDDRGVTLLCVTCANAEAPNTPMVAVPGSMAELEAELTPEDYMLTRVLMAMVGIEEDEGSGGPPQPHSPDSNDIQKGNDDNTHS